MEPGTIGNLFENKCDIFQERTALTIQSPEGVKTIGYDRYRSVTRALASGMRKRGLRPGQRVAILGPSEPERCFVFFAIQLCGAVDVSFDETLVAEKQAFLLRKTRCGICFVPDAAVARQLATLLAGVTFYLLTWRRSGPFESLGELTGFTGGQLRDPGPVTWHTARLNDDPASIVFKRIGLRGTRPEGIVLTHRNILKNLEAVHASIPATENDSLQLTAPLWHTMGRFGILFALWNGANLVLSADDTMIADLATFRPTMALAPPEHFEQLYTRLINGNGTDQTRKILIRKAYFFAAGWSNWAERVLAGQRLLFRTENQFTDPLRILTALAVLVFLAPIKLIGDLTVGGRIRKRLGGRLRAILTGGSSLAFAIDQFFQSVNVAVLEGYWMTETGFMVACRALEYTGQRSRLTPRTVGPVLPGFELKLIDHRDEDVSHIPGNPGRVFVRGESVMQGYFSNPPGTAEVLDSNGWFRTADRARLTINGELQILRPRGLPRDLRIED